MRDITAEIKAKEVAHELTRLRTAVQVVTELAHHVRNSLTTIQGATEVSERIIRDISRAHNISASDQQDLATMCESVSRQIEHLDERLSDFLDGVVENPAELVRQASEAYAKYFEGGGPPR